MGRVTAPEPHNPPPSRRAARLQRERDAERALEDQNALGRRRRSRTRRAASAAGSGRRSAAADRAAAGHRRRHPPRPNRSRLGALVRSRRRRLHRPTARDPAIACAADCTRPPAHTHSGGGDASGCAAFPSRGEDGRADEYVRVPGPPRARAAAPVRVGVVAGLAVVASLVLGIHRHDDGGRHRSVAVPRRSAARRGGRRRSSAAATPTSVPQRAAARARRSRFPAPTVEAAPAAVDLCAIPTFVARARRGRRCRRDRRRRRGRRLPHRGRGRRRRRASRWAIPAASGS